jgi:hypothetical protein
MLDRFWDFLKDETNRNILGLIGTVIAALAAGIWAVIKRREKGPPPTPSVTADHGSVAAGRDITGPVTINPDPKEVV